MEPPRRRLLAAFLGAAGLGGLGGCLGGGEDTPTPDPATPTATGPDPTSTTAGPASPTPFSGTVDFPDGPRAPPERPATLTPGAVRAYVREYEYRYAYNAVHGADAGDDDADDPYVALTCEVRSVERAGPGYRAVAQCVGYRTGTPTETARDGSTGTPPTVVYEDWPDPTAVYLVDDNATVRRLRD